MINTGPVGTTSPTQPTRIVYVAGPMRGIKYFNFPAFDAAKAELESQGFEVMSPADLDRSAGFDPEILGGDHDWTDLNSCDFSLMDAIDRDVEALKRCDAIYMLRGWERSKGAKAEKALAEWMGLEVLYQEPEDILEEALRITKGDRNNDYGHPFDDFTKTAAMWSAILGTTVGPEHVAMCMICVKLSRQCNSPKRDNLVDGAGYFRTLDMVVNHPDWEPAG